MLKTKVKEATLKILTFPLGNLFLAVKLEGVKKVIPVPAIAKSGNKLLGITNFEDQEIIVVDLHQRILNASNAIASRYLIVIQSELQALYGIPVISLPEMLEVPISTIHPIPDDYRNHDTLGIADRVTQISVMDKTRTIFLLSSGSIVNFIRKEKSGY
ncbi:chemotaxis protein CheW [Tumidithrix elongata RA019]|uniref:Chemotaxis protein CheW n=1 Tax=Tumidithrix elongata BACA0141 TaxID=2716417 RepID=A0AAW9PZU9_9CYAN|nr:chemotaxis protein CheW [Tumidithrix elongata RA019]